MRLFVFNNDVDLPHWKIHIHWQNFCIKFVLDKFIWAKGPPPRLFYSSEVIQVLPDVHDIK